MDPKLTKSIPLPLPPGGPISTPGGSLIDLDHLRQIFFSVQSSSCSSRSHRSSPSATAIVPHIQIQVNPSPPVASVFFVVTARRFTRCGSARRGTEVPSAARHGGRRRGRLHPPSRSLVAGRHPLPVATAAGLRPLGRHHGYITQARRPSRNRAAVASSSSARRGSGLPSSFAASAFADSRCQQPLAASSRDLHRRARAGDRRRSSLVRRWLHPRRCYGFRLGGDRRRGSLVHRLVVICCSSALAEACCPAVVRSPSATQGS
uniref:Uncharacterized protein n=1 Tax=Arundo donax TaxID=35708 RepID=A0A0A8Y3L0_ARUDO